MIVSTFLLLLAAYFLTGLVLPFVRNIHIAKRSGLRYVIVPYFMYDNSWPSKHLRPPFRKLLDILFYDPNPSPASWQHLISPLWPLKFRHAPFKLLGTDTFLTVAPGGIVLNTADADVITQILARPIDFPKPTQLYRGISIYGKNLFSTEGPTWKRQRRLINPAFSEKTNKLVWKETLGQARAMVASWVGTNASGKSIRYVARDTMRLSLAIIGRAGFGQQTEWSGSADDGEKVERKRLPAGHSMTFTDSFQYVALNVFTLANVLRFPIRIGSQWFPPSRRKALEAYNEWRRYMEEMIATKKQQIDSEASQSSTVDILAQLIQHNEEDSSALTDNEVLGNLFFFIIAGHETTASSLHMSILLLALHPKIQSEVQRELAEILGDRPPSEWSYEHDLPRLFNGTLHAVLLEELRLVSPILTIPKVVYSRPQHIMINGRETTLPANTTIRLCMSAVHVNSRFWPHEAPTDPQNPIFPLDNLDNDLEEFKPQRWFKPGVKPMQSLVNENANGKPHEFDTQTSIAGSASRLYTPAKGSYIPFGEGQRSCLGRRFAQVEILTALAVVFSQYSVELAVGEWSSDREVSEMTKEQRKETWDKAAEIARRAWKEKLTSGLTVKLRGDAHVPFRFVKKGKESFFDL